MVLFTVAVYFLMLSVSVLAQTNARREIRIPDIRGYVTLKCDFHLHTVFSDGNVWPVTRVQEAWKEGLDAISITDHIEYQPHRADIPTKHNRPYEIALSAANSANLILIKGAEITRDTPPGHHNAIFVSEIDSLDRKDFYQAFDEAEEQGSFIFYNHPGWKHPQGTAEWFEYQTTLFGKGHLYGIEVVNGNDYYPLAHQWCIDKKFAMLGNSDEHNPITFTYDFAKGEHRPMTLVFAKKRTADSIKEALFARRTAVWWKGGLIGDREFLSPIFQQSIAVVTPQLTVTGNGSAFLQICNTSDVAFEIETTGATEPVSLPKAFLLPAGKTVIVPIRKTAKEVFGRKSVRIPVAVKNLFTEPEKGMAEEIGFMVDFQRPAGK
jgi:hypothetical protein